MTSGYRRPADPDALANNFRVFASADCANEPLYGALSQAIAHQPDTLALLMEAPYAQRRAVLLFGAVHDLLLAGTGHPLAAFYGTVVGANAVRTDVERAADLFADFCRSHREPLLERIRARTVQTNEVGRCAGLRLALAADRRPDDPIALIDVGCSAGLNLLVDRYRFEWTMADGAVRTAGPDDGAVVVRSQLSGSDPGDVDAMPPIGRRFGIDLTPLDVRDEDDARWLQACVWPGDAARHERLAAAMALARDATLDLRAGDAVERLSEVVDTLDRDARPVVFHSWVVSYFEHPARRAFVDLVRRIVVDRDGLWISAEAPNVVPGLAPPPLPDTADVPLREATVWHVTSRRDDEAATRAVARSHPHCRWIEWL